MSREFCARNRERIHLPPEGVTVFGGCRTTAVSLAIPAIIAPFLLGSGARMLIGFVTADHASGTRSEQSVMAGVMACDPTDDGTL